MEKIRLAACIIYSDINEVLLQKKTQDYKLPGFWALFGGHIEGNETPIETIKRELKEELNIEFDKIEFCEEFSSVYKNKEYEIHIFKTKFNKKISDISIGEGCGVAFFTKDEINDLKLMFDVKMALDHYFANK